MSQEPKILHIVTALSWRGGEQQAAYLIEQLKEKAQQWVLCSEGSEMAAYCERNKIEFFTQRKRSGLDLAYAKKIKSICSAKAIDLCHLHDAHAHSFSILAADLYRNKTPLMLSRRVDFPIKNKWTSRYKYNHPQIKKILCVSRMIQEITSKGIQDQTKLATVYSGIDLGKFGERKGLLRKELGFSDSNFLIGNSSALADHKDYFTFLDTAELVLDKESEVQFLIFGDGPMKKQIQEYASQKKHTDRIHFLGFRKDIPQVLPDLDLFFISSKTEGLGTSILDAFACKVPVVATAAGGIPELVEDMKTGLLREVGDSQSLAKAICSILHKETNSAELTGQAWQKVQEFSKQVTAEKTWQQYLAIIA